jgi:predicted DNA-binding transcriptional regulator YafY
VPAGRLLAVLLLLQGRGRLTARELAQELEVSVRTVYRDVEALSAAGVPVYADRGPDGGYRLVEGYRTRLTGLTGAEADTLFLAGAPGPAAELGLGAELAAAQLKLAAALAPELRERAGRIRERFHLDAPGWFREREPTPHLAGLAEAVWQTRRIEVRYRGWGSAPTESDRVLEPLGLVCKAGVWYLVAARPDRPERPARTYRVGRIVALGPGEPFDRPAGFDLAAFWQDWARRFEAAVHTAEMTVRLSPAGFGRLAALWSVTAQRAAERTAGEPDHAGWRSAVIPVESLRHALVEVLKLGPEIEVLAPAELRRSVSEALTAAVDRYR